MTNLDLMEVNDLSKNANGGTEQMLKRIYNTLPRELLNEFQIIPSRVRDLKQDKYRLYYCHDLPGDPEVNTALGEGEWYRFHRIVFVSNWQAQRFIDLYNIPWSRTVILPNAIEPLPTLHEGEKKDSEQINLIYHTTPDRGLNILLPVFDKLSEKYDNIHLDVYSSFKLYGWEQRDEEFEDLFNFMKDHPKITSHGAVPSDEVRHALLKSHIFAYPSIWPETSCLCLMEAMSAGLNCVHPDYGALYETAANWTTMYHFHEDPQEHAKFFGMMLENAIIHVNNENIQGRLASQRVYANAFYNWHTRAKQWEALMQSILASDETRDAEKPEKEFVYRV